MSSFDFLFVTGSTIVLDLSMFSSELSLLEASTKFRYQVSTKRTYWNVQKSQNQYILIILRQFQINYYILSKNSHFDTVLIRKVSELYADLFMIYCEPYSLEKWNWNMLNLTLQNIFYCNHAPIDNLTITIKQKARFTPNQITYCHII